MFKFITHWKQNQERQQILDYVNLIRSEFDLKPMTHLPKGYKRTPHKCVIAMCFAEIQCSNPQGLELVSVTSGNLRVGKHHYDVPEHIGQFIHKFDQGKFPELEAHHL